MRYKLLYNHITYALACQYAINLFNKVNGLANPIFPAKMLLFDINNNWTAFGKSYGDVVIIYMHNILKFIKNDMSLCDNRILKGMIAHVLIHELMHLDQDFYAYDNIPNPEKTSIIESSCNEATHHFIKHLICNESSKIYYDLDIDTRVLESTFWERFTSDIYIDTVYLNSYYTITSPLDKALFTLDMLLYNGNHDLEPSIRQIVKMNNTKYLYLALSFSGVEKFNEIIYSDNRFLGSIYIMNILTPLILILESRPVQMCVSRLQIATDTSIEKVVFDIRSDSSEVITPLIASNDNPILF